MAELTVTVGVAFMVTVIAQVATLPHASVAVHFTVDKPTLNVPLASCPLPLLVVVPVT